MEARKLLYVTDLKEKSLSFNLLKGILPVHKLGFNEIAVLQTSPYNSWLNGLADFNMTSKIILDDQLLPGKILNTAKNEGTSLIVVNLDREQGKAAKKAMIKPLIRYSALPILFMNNPDQEIKSDQKGIFSSVVFATDWSETSERALAFLLDFKNILGELEIVHVIKGKLTIKEMRELKDRLLKTRRICLDKKIDAESHIYAGKTSEEILTAARDYKTAMVVVGGESEKKGLSRIFKKRSSWKVVCETDLPVMVVP